MNFEILANELILEIFEYLNLVQQFHAFYNLNHRLNNLLLGYCQVNGHFNFESISKTIFDIICQKYLTNQVRSIHLSDNNETPQIIHHFHSYNFRFNNLQSLSLSYLQSETTLINIIMDLHKLPYLTHLKINKCQVDSHLINNGWIFDRIWRLQKLTHCHFERKKFLFDPFFIAPKSISMSIQYLYLEGFLYNADELHRLFENTINLKDINLSIEHNYNYQKISSNFLLIKKLQISVEHSLYVINNLLQHMPNLTHLIIELKHIVIDGDRWQEILQNNLPNLRIFNMKMQFYRQHSDESMQQIEQLVHSFDSLACMKEHPRYIQCHWYLASNHFLNVCLYTLPYSFQDFSITSDMQFRSTCLNQQMNSNFDAVHNLSFQNSCPYMYRFNNVRHLELYFPVTTSFWLIVPNLNRLVSLDVTLSEHFDNREQLVRILQNATCLYSLTLRDTSSTNDVLCSLESSSIRRLCLYDYGCFNDALMNSPLGIQCEVLFITVKDRTNIVSLITHMRNLRALHVRLQDDESQEEDTLVKFLKNYLPKSSLIRREYNNNNNNFCLQIWIR